MLVIDERLRIIRRRRVASRVSQSELAPRTPMSRARLNQAELGHLTLRPEEIARLDKALTEIIEERVAEMRSVAKVEAEE